MGHRLQGWPGTSQVCPMGRRNSLWIQHGLVLQYSDASCQLHVAFGCTDESQSLLHQAGVSLALLGPGMDTGLRGLSCIPKSSSLHGQLREITVNNDCLTMAANWVGAQLLSADANGNSSFLRRSQHKSQNPSLSPCRQAICHANTSCCRELMPGFFL